MNQSSATKRAEDFLAQSGEFRLGDLVTEQSHSVTRELSQTAEQSIPDSLELLFQIDSDVIETYRRWIATGTPERIKDVVLDALWNGHRIFFTGCGATGRLSILLESIWREFFASTHWHNASTEAQARLSDNVASIMSGGDYALIKSVEGFEDFSQFGAKQIEDMGVSEGDVVFAITEGGETSFVIGTAWKALEKGAKVFFVYCNPDDILRKTVTRSREILDEPRIEKINLTTGPMAIMGSTRMQATSIQLIAMLTILEMSARELSEHTQKHEFSTDKASKTYTNLDYLESNLLFAMEEVHHTLMSEEIRTALADMVELEAETYRGGSKSTYFADRLAIDVLTDTTERSPTFCTPAFKKWDDEQASESWAYLILPHADSRTAWESMLHRPPYGLTWSDDEILNLVGSEKAKTLSKIIREIGPEEIVKFRIGLDGLEHRRMSPGDLAVCVVTEAEMQALTAPNGFYRRQLETMNASGVASALIFLGSSESVEQIRDFLKSWKIPCKSVLLPLPKTDFLLDPIPRLAIKMLLNALSTAVMVKLGRVQGNCMVAVVPSNLKLIDRATRYVQTLTGLSYETSCRLLFESIEYVTPRMQSAQAYPPPVKLTLQRIAHNCSLQEAERRL